MLLSLSLSLSLLCTEPSFWHLYCIYIYSNPTVKAVVTTGTGRFYSNGLDLQWLNGLGIEEKKRFRQNIARMYARLLTFPLPTVAVINGNYSCLY